MRKGFLTPSKESGKAKSKSSPRAQASKATTLVADVSDLLAEKLDLDLVDAPGGASSSSSSSSSSPTAPLPLQLTDIPNQVLVSILVVAVGRDMIWARYTIPSVCKAFRDLCRSRDASPLHERLFLDFEKEIAKAKKGSSRRSPRREPVVRASRVISWAQQRAESVRALLLFNRNGASLGDFNATNFAQLVAAVGPHLTKLVAGLGFEKLVGPPFWASLRGGVVPARKLRTLQVINIKKGLSMSDVEPLVQLRGSLEVLSLCGSFERKRGRKRASQEFELGRSESEENFLFADFNPLSKHSHSSLSRLSLSRAPHCRVPSLRLQVDKSVSFSLPLESDLSCLMTRHAG